MTSALFVGTGQGRVTRIIGWANLGVASLGLVQLAFNVIGYFVLGENFVKQYGPFLTYEHRFSIMSAATLVLLIPLGVLGCLLLSKPGTVSIAITKIFFVLEMVTMAWILANWSMPFFPISPIMIATGLMNAGLALQIATAYPLIGLFFLMRASHKR
jgi:hypothetical protein